MGYPGVFPGSTPCKSKMARWILAKRKSACSSRGSKKVGRAGGCRPRNLYRAAARGGGRALCSFSAWGRAISFPGGPAYRRSYQVPYGGDYHFAPVIEGLGLRPADPPVELHMVFSAAGRKLRYFPGET